MNKMNISSSKQSLFPTSVWKYQLQKNEQKHLNQKLTNKILSLRSNKDSVIAANNKWYTPRNLHETPEFSMFNEFVLQASKLCLNDMHIDYEDLKITGCWGNVSGPGATHHSHSHPNNYLSGCYYLYVNEGSNTIRFHDPKPRQNIRPPIRKFTHETAETINMTVQSGDLLLFPHWLVHSVDENQSKDNRITIAFNIMFSNYMADMVAPMW